MDPLSSPLKTPKFLTDLCVRDVTYRNKGKTQLILMEELVFDSAILGTIIVPVGFVTDLASIPQPLWSILPPIGSYDRAAVVHDYLYTRNGCTRGEADNVLKEGMKVDEVQGLKLRMIYAGVRMGGWKIWNRYRNAERNAT